jgi:hypothetical protein
MDKDSQEISKNLLSPSPIWVDDDKDEVFKMIISLIEKYSESNKSETIEKAKRENN